MGSPTNTRRPLRRASLALAALTRFVRFKTTMSGLCCSISNTSPGLNGVTARRFWSTVVVMLSFQEFFADLDGVEGGAFEELIAGNPKGQAVVQRAVAAEAADGAIILAGHEQRLRILVFRRLINDLQPRRLLEHVAGGFD